MITVSSVALAQHIDDSEALIICRKLWGHNHRAIGTGENDWHPHGGDPATRQVRGDTTLANLEISKDLSARARRIASVPEEKPDIF